MPTIPNRFLLVTLATIVAAGALAVTWFNSGEASLDPYVSISTSQQKTLASSKGIGQAYSAAAEETAKCLTDAGLNNVSVSRDAAGKASFTWAGFATHEEARRAGETYKRCYFEHMDDIDRTWQQSPEQETAATQRGWDVLKCIEAARPGLTFGPDEATVNSQLAALERTRDEFTGRCLALAGTDVVKFTPLPR